MESTTLNSLSVSLSWDEFYSKSNIKYIVGCNESTIISHSQSKSLLASLRKSPLDNIDNNDIGIKYLKNRTIKDLQQFFENLKNNPNNCTIIQNLMYTTNNSSHNIQNSRNIPLLLTNKSTSYGYSDISNSYESTNEINKYNYNYNSDKSSYIDVNILNKPNILTPSNSPKRLKKSISENGYILVKPLVLEMNRSNTIKYKQPPLNEESSKSNFSYISTNSSFLSGVSFSLPSLPNPNRHNENSITTDNKLHNSNNNNSNLYTENSIQNKPILSNKISNNTQLIGYHSYSAPIIPKKQNNTNVFNDNSLVNDINENNTNVTKKASVPLHLCQSTTQYTYITPVTSPIKKHLSNYCGYTNNNSSIFFATLDEEEKMQKPVKVLNNSKYSKKKNSKKKHQRTKSGKVTLNNNEKKSTDTV